jgi:hypothetical protein
VNGHTSVPAWTLNHYCFACVLERRRAPTAVPSNGEQQVTQHTMTTSVSPVIVRTDVVPAIAVRVTGALLALAIAAVHVADQGGITLLATPSWIGWGYRFIEAGAVLAAVLLVLPRPAWLFRSWLGWAAGLLLGAGPLVGYLASRTVGLPGDHGDVGNWGYWTGTVSLFVEAALIVLSLTMLLSYLARRGQPWPR